jgi:tetratricopeptide (TPR) repeat protein
MHSGPGERYDFFLSRRGSVAPIAREVADVLVEKGYKVLVEDYDFQLGASFVAAMHDGVTNARDLIVLLTRDYLQTPYTRKEFTSFEAQALSSLEKRYVIILRCEDVPLEGLLADHVYQDLVGIQDPDERKRRIIAAAERQSQAAPLPPRPFIGVPPRISSFTGRTDELDKLDAILMRDKPAAVTQASVGRVAVQGMGGVGKTSLAIEYTHRYRNLYTGVCWCPAETRTGLLNALANLAVTLGAVRAGEADAEKSAKAALGRLAEQRATWLLVYDNVTSPEEISDLLPSAGARVLITSRFSDWGGLADEVPLDVLPPGEATAFLQGRAGRSDPPGAKTLAEALGHLPLALDHAAAYCKRTQVCFGDYAEKASRLIRTAPRGAGYPRSVAATFDLAIAEAATKCHAAETLMAYLAQCAPERIPMMLVEGAIGDETERMEALGALTEVSLLKHDPFEDRTPAVTVHRLVHAVARVRSQTYGSPQSAVRQLIARLVAIYPKKGDSDRRSWSLCAQLTPHLLALRDLFPDVTLDSADCAALLGSAGGYFLGRGAYSQAVRSLRDALAIREKVLGHEHPYTAGSLNDLAVLLRHQGDLTGARLLHERALAIRERVLGPEHPDTAESLNELAVVIQEHDLKGARRLHERALAIRDKVLGPEHPQTAASLIKLWSVLWEEGDLAGARPLLERALAIRERVLGPEHPDTAWNLHYLANHLFTEGDFAGARRLYERALIIREKVLGPEHQDDLVGTRPLLERALAIRQKVLCPEHPNTATSLNKLAALLRAQGDLAGARPLFERALALSEKVAGPEHPYTAVALTNLALLLQTQGDLARARPLYERALAIREKALAPEHPDTATSFNNLALLLQAQGDLAGARPLYERALAIREKVFGPEHQNTNRTRSNLAQLLLTNGQPTEALALGQSALAAHDKALGRDQSLGQRQRPRYRRARCAWLRRGSEGVAGAGKG